MSGKCGWTLPCSPILSKSDVLPIAFCPHPHTFTSPIWDSYGRVLFPYIYTLTDTCWRQQTVEGINTSQCIGYVLKTSIYPISMKTKQRILSSLMHNQNHFCNIDKRFVDAEYRVPHIWLIKLSHLACSMPGHYLTQFWQNAYSIHAKWFNSLRPSDAYMRR